MVSPTTQSSPTTWCYHMVLPNGTIALIDEHDPDMFFALKGGLNRFGVVTSINYKAVAQPNLVYGGLRIYLGSGEALNEAVLKFQQTNTDPKAEVLYTIEGGLNFESITANFLLILFYDGSEKPEIFDSFDIDASPVFDNVKCQSFIDFENGIPSLASSGNRGAYHTLMTTGLTSNFLKAVVNECYYYGTLSLEESVVVTSYDVEPFMTGNKGYGQHAADSAFLHVSSPLPLNLFYEWKLEENDAYWHGIMQQSVSTLTEIAKAEGIYSEDNYAYPNYALYTYTGDQIYGPKNSARLRQIQAKVDQNGVMKGLSGGFDI